MKQFACQSLVPGCEAVFTGESDSEVLLQVVEHADDEHAMSDSRAQLAVCVLDELDQAA